jgi:dipeptidyl aminopeptidase/acylaminoacyl peptidase
VAVVAAVLLVGVVVQQTMTSPAARVVRSVRLTFTGQAAFPSLEADWFPALATEGGRVYFTRMTENGLTLVQSSVGGGEVVPIRTPLNQPFLVNVSPDGSRLLVRESENAPLEGPLWVVPAVGGAPLRLGAVVAHDGAWSPDGKRMVFARGDELYLAGSDGSEPRKLATTPGRASWMRWSPDGARLRFTVVSPQGETRSLWEVSAEGHGLRPVPLGRSEHDVDCCGEWSPDGRHFSSAGSVTTGATSGPSRTGGASSAGETPDPRA